MSKHNNPSITERARRIFNNQLGQEISNEILDYITPTIEIEPKTNIFKTAATTNATSTTIYTTPADKDFYLTNINISLAKDVTSTSGYSALRGFISGVNMFLLTLRTLTLTPQIANESLNLKYPLKLDRNTIITLVNETNVANITSSAEIYGYLEEVKNPATF